MESLQRVGVEVFHFGILVPFIFSLFATSSFADEYQYDSLDRLTLVIRADGRTTQYLYDPAGNLMLEVVSKPAGQSNTPPIAISRSVGSQAGGFAALVLEGSDPDGDAVWFIVNEYPANGFLYGNAPNLFYAPNAGFVGVDSFKFYVHDGTAQSPEATVTINVHDTNSAPTAHPQTLSTAQNVPLQITLDGSDPESDALQFFVSFSPSNGIFTGIGRTLYYHPNPGFSGTDSLMFVASDGALSSTPAAITINVGSSGPAAIPQLVTTTEDVEKAIVLAGTHPQGSTLSYSLATSPTNGLLTGTPPDVTYIPNLHFNGDDAFEFTVSDASTTSAPATVSIEVTPVNDVPIAFNTTAQAVQGQAVNINLLGEDVDGDVLSFAISSAPANGSLSGEGSTRTYVSSGGFIGIDQFQFTVNDGAATSAAGTVTIDVTDSFVKTGAFGDTQRVSVSSAEAQANGGSSNAFIAGDGRYVSFASQATNLVAGDTNAQADTFIRDLQATTTSRTSLGAGGVVADAATDGASSSSNGRYVVFSTVASNLVAGDNNGVADVFLRDRSTGTTTRISVSSTGTDPDGSSDQPFISADGAFVAFRSEATNLVSGDTNGMADIFVREISTGVITRVNVRTSGLQAAGGASETPALSADGRYVVFSTNATNLVAGDVNGVADVYLRDRQVPSTTRISIGLANAWANGESRAPSISGDGRYVAFSSVADNLAAGDSNTLSDVYLRDRQTNTTQRISRGLGGTDTDGASFDARVGASGRWITFTSEATNLVSDDTNTVADVFVQHLGSGRIRRASVDSSGEETGLPSGVSTISSTGRYVVFESDGTSLAPSDTNASRDIFVRDRWPHAALLPAGIASGDRAGYAVAIDGDTAVVGSRLDDHSGYTNIGSAHVFQRNPATGAWTQLATLTGTVDTSSDQDKFGHAVAVSGDVIAVSAENDDDAAFRSGRVYLYGRNVGGTENWGLIKSVTAGDIGERFYFGRSIGLSGERLVVGAHQAFDTGAAYVFERHQGGSDNWGQVAKLVASSAAVGDRFGAAVAIDGDVIAIGDSRKTTGAGAAAGAGYVFTKTGGTWTQIRQLTAALGAANDQFGYAIDVSGDTVAVGVRFADSAEGNQTGSVILYGRNTGGANNWGEVRTVLAADRKAGDRFGSSVALSGDGLLVGSPLQDDMETDGGKAYVFKLSGESVDQLVNEHVTLLDEFGVAVAMDGSTCIVGSWLDNRPGNNSGAAYVFEAR